MADLVFGLDTFGDVPEDDAGAPVSYAAAIRQVVEEAVLADELGVDAIALGEHHRPEYSISTPETVLAGIATRTSRIRLGSGVTVLSSDDPVRVFQRFATVDALSNGRAEVILGRGSFTESFPLFGYDLRDYDVLFEEKIDLFVEAARREAGHLERHHARRRWTNADVFPKTESGRLTTWVGVGGSPQSVVRTARYGLPLMLAIIGGAPERFAPYLDLYRRAAEQFGTIAHPVGMHSPGFIADTDEEARELFWPRYRVMRDRIGALRGWPPIRRRGVRRRDRARLAVRRLAGDRRPQDRPRGPARSASAGSTSSTPPDALPVSARLQAVELYGTKVIPMVREILADATATGRTT